MKQQQKFSLNVRLTVSKSASCSHICDNSLCAIVHFNKNAFLLFCVLCETQNNSWIHRTWQTLFKNVKLLFLNTFNATKFNACGMISLRNTRLPYNNAWTILCHFFEWNCVWQQQNCCYKQNKGKKYENAFRSSQSVMKSFDWSFS